MFWMSFEPRQQHVSAVQHLLGGVGAGEQLEPAGELVARLELMYRADPALARIVARAGEERDADEGRRCGDDGE